ncbi:MAG: alpha/beta hydrolase, partial [Acidimicrobiia bacterium]|nr:alpha/beta hydrolase [Acidimicrobiia bacterium]
MASTTSQLMAGDGVGLLTRHWSNNTPRARVLIVHGLGEHSGRYEHVGEYLVARGFEVAAYDHRGHGASGGMRVDLESFSEYLDDLASVVTSIATDVPLIIYGHSMGGLVAAAYAASSRPQPAMYVLSAPALSADVPLHLRMIAKVGNRLRPMMYFPNSIKGEQLSHDPSVGEKYFADPLVETRTTARFGATFIAQMDLMT